jgi:hypothetical protein
VETLNLPFIAQSYALPTQNAAQQESAYSEFLEQSTYFPQLNL